MFSVSQIKILLNSIKVITSDFVRFHRVTYPKSQPEAGHNDHQNQHERAHVANDLADHSDERTPALEASGVEEDLDEK